MTRRSWHSRDILMLLLYAPGASDRIGEPILGRTRLMKLSYLFREEAYESFRFNRVFPVEVLPPFEAWKFGPFSRDVFIDADFLVQTGFVRSSAVDKTDATEAGESEFEYWRHELALDERDQDDEYYEECFVLTDRGRSFVEERLLPLLEENQVSALYEFKKRYNSLPLRVLLRYVYENYPEMTSRSEIAGDVLR